MQYMAVKTKNILEPKERMFHWKGEWFMGLVDEDTSALYDHPEDSFMEHLGMENSVDAGYIVPIQGELVNWKDKLPWLPNLDTWFTIPKPMPVNLGVNYA